ncbi:sacsin N-terminal ATP-binding-like domain-containing protein [Winogradskyella poriferorum]|uniref:sacsin N-terminal ATP-binding-like domain-containing protein n=1 Tax=Winogradskyella poriferorum TaxID=307627 RepID=UPI003D662DEE
MSTIPLNRQEILDRAKRESELSDLKQHADKMIRGFENFNDFSSNRAIWELVQNACDLTTECKVTIDYSNKYFSFSHNGKPFTTNSLNSLIKQVSGKYGEDADIPEVGKYGTGFLTTHTFGRRFVINSVMEAEGAFFELKDFEIDRTPKEWKELSENIRLQKKKVYEIIEGGTIIQKPSEFKTTFTYIPSTPQENQYIKESSHDLEDYVPLVLTINNRLKQIEIINEQGVKTTFFFESKIPIENEANINLFKTIIYKNGEELYVYSLVDEANEIEVILPINKDLTLFEFPERIARLFLYYPLVGSEDFGLNFIINCNQFLPNEPRSGVHLNSNKDQVREQEEANRNILETASSLVFIFLKSNTLKVDNPLLYANVNFKRNSENALLNEYFEGLQEVWNEELKNLPIVETSEGFKEVREVLFLDEELFLDKKVFDDVYKLVNIFYKNVPKKEKCKQWSSYAKAWDDDEVEFITHDDLVKGISNENLSKFDRSNLINYYQSLITQDKASVFADYKLLPNLKGEFCYLNILLLPSSITPKLIELANVLIPETIDKLILSDFQFQFNLEEFNRKDYSTSVKNKLDELEADKLVCLPETFDSEIYNPIELEEEKLDFKFFEALINYCKLSNTIESQSKPAQLLRLISKYYGLNEDLIHLPNVLKSEENLEVRSSRKILVKIFFNLLSQHNQDWVRENISLLLNVANCYEDSLKEVYSDSCIYPNQIFQLKQAHELKRDINILDEIKDLYNKVNGDVEIRSKLVYEGFNDFIDEEDFINNKYLTTKIEDIFFETDILDINEHPYKDEILDIISKLNIKTYKELFPRLDDKKAKLMLDVVTNERTKDDIFSIVTLKEDKLKKLGELVKNENFDEILNKAELLALQEKYRQADFQHKYEIGTNIERLIREKLSKELQDRVTFKNDESIEMTDIQGGQDIVVFLDNKPFYFIEVKSRWNSDSSVSMSKLQLQRAVEENERYSLCSVDISKYTGINNRYNLPVDEIIPLTKFINDIGTNIQPLIESNLHAEKNSEKLIHLIDYRGIIPQDVIKDGSEFNEFLETLLNKINKEIESNV